MKKLTLKEAVLRFVLMLAAVLVFTFFDWLVHSSSAYLSVPGFYFRNKIMYGTVLAFLSSLVFRKLSLGKQSLFTSLITVGVLQIRYALYGYPLYFHLIVLPEHFIVLWASSYGALKVLGSILKRK